MKFIQPPQINQQEIMNKFAEYLKGVKTQTGKINFTYEMAKPDKTIPKATLEYTKEAWDKLWALVAEFSGEVGWHGTVKRDGNHYTITDILVYPQEVTGVTVNTDQTEYNEWLMGIPDDETYNSVRFQGHSHVNMGITPSNVDLNMYERILENMGSEDFYIFGIYNKRKDCFLTIYDFANNIIYEKADIIIVTPTSNFIAEAKKLVKERPKVQVSSPTFGHAGYRGGVDYSKYSSYKDSPSQRKQETIEDLTEEEENYIRTRLGYGYDRGYGY